MSDVASVSRHASPPPPDDRLESWKEIAAYLKRDVSTVQRWEKKERLPIYRLPHDKLGSVFAFKRELDAWLNRGSHRLEKAEASPRWRRAVAASAERLAFLGAWLRGLLRGPDSRRSVLVLASLVTFAWWALVQRGPDSTPAVRRLSIPFATAPGERDPEPPTLALSPDGSRLVFRLGQEDYTGALHSRSLDRFEAAPIPGTEGGTMPFFSPDGRWLGFVSDRAIKRLAFAGGGATRIADVGNPFGATWGPDDEIIFTPLSYAGLHRVSAAGGPVTVLTTPDRQRREKSHRWPEFVPGARAVIFTTVKMDISSFDDADIEVLSLDTGARRRLIEGGSRARIAPNGSLVYVRGSALHAVPFDTRRLEVTGPPARVIDDLLPSNWLPHYTFSSDGTLVYVPSHGRKLGRELVWLDRQGQVAALPLPERVFRAPRLSPDGSRIAVQVEGANEQIWIHDLARGVFTQLTTVWDNEGPVWSPDSRYVAFASPRDGDQNIYVAAVDGSARVERLTVSAQTQGPVSWSPDGKWLAFVEWNPQQGDIWMLPMDGHRKPQPFLVSSANEEDAVFSPDGRSIAYTSNESGRFQVYVTSFPGPGAKLQVSIDGGTQPRWGADGREVYFRSGQMLMGVDISPAKPQRAGRPRILAEKAFDAGGLIANYDVTKDGRRFIMVRELPQPPISTLNVVLNWFTDLERRMQ
jgi:Tol biopolymer transport system component